MPVSFLIKLQASAYNFILKKTHAKVFSGEVGAISKNNFFKEHLQATLSETETAYERRKPDCKCI